MKKILVTILLIIFFVGVYMNFGMGDTVDQLSFTSSNDEETNEERAPDEETSENDSETQEEETPEDENSDGEALTFSQPALNEKFEDAESNNEPLIIDILLPAYYSDDFTERLANAFDTNAIQFNRQDLNVNTTDLSEVSISDNSDAVIIDALQVQDYNDEVLFDRENDNLTDVYMNVYDGDRVAYILGNPNIHEHENLVEVLDEDAAYFSDNDYYYIDNQEIDVNEDYDYDTDMMSTSAEDAVIQNIYDYLVE